MRTALLALAVLATSVTSARAGIALDDDGKTPAAATGSGSAATASDGAPSGASAAEPAALPDPNTLEPPVEYGIGVRFREVFIPRSIFELFVKHAAGGVQDTGAGVDLTRRHGSTEIQLGFEYEHINVPEGVWINKGDTVPTDEVDYILSPQESGNQFGWFTIELTFLNHAKITDWLSFRYGGGLGIGILTGEVDHYNIRCTNSSSDTNTNPGCIPMRFPGGQGTYTDPDPGHEVQVAYDIPPVFPVVNAIIGLQFKPTDKMTINVEGGIRTLPFIGLDASYFF